jgi:hypothetical protein
VRHHDGDAGLVGVLAVGVRLSDNMISWDGTNKQGHLTPKLTGAVARSAEGTNTGHQNAEGMASVGVRVEPPVMPHFILEQHQARHKCCL